MTALTEVGDLTQRYVLQDKARTFGQWAQSLMIAGGDPMEAAEVFGGRWPKSKHLDAVRKAAVGPGSTTGWGGEIAPLSALGTAYLDFIRPLTVLGRLTGVRRAPFDVAFLSQNSAFGVGWAGEGKPVLVAKAGFERTVLAPTKIGGIVVLTKELVRAQDPASEAMVQRDLTGAVIEFSDVQFLDPALSANQGVSPASITNGATEITSTGLTAAAVEADLSALVGVLLAGGVALTAPHWIMKPSTALALAKLRGNNGERVFPDVGPLGGTIWTIPVVTTPSAGDQIVILDAAEVIIAEDGVELSSSSQGTVQMSDDLTAEAAEGGNTVSLWQANLLALKVMRYVSWMRRRDEAVAWMAVAY